MNRRRKRTLIRLLAVITLTIAATVILLPAFTPCPVEDGTWCHWDADQLGNGRGQSFVTYSEGVTLTLGPRYQ